MKIYISFIQYSDKDRPELHDSQETLEAIADGLSEYLHMIYPEELLAGYVTVEVADADIATALRLQKGRATRE
jgi:hypothetical protein